MSVLVSSPYTNLEYRSFAYQAIRERLSWQLVCRLQLFVPVAYLPRYMIFETDAMRLGAIFCSNTIEIMFDRCCQPRMHL
jgi:hypothetical protein